MFVLQSPEACSVGQLSALARAPSANTYVTLRLGTLWEISPISHIFCQSETGCAFHTGDPVTMEVDLGKNSLCESSV